MARNLSELSLAMRVTLFFAHNPDEELTTVDVAEKYDVRVRYVESGLGRAVQSGMLSRTSKGPGRGNVATYAAGPLILEALGLAMQACAPAGNMRVSAGGG